MKRIFISMPMRDLFEDEIRRRQEKLLELAGEFLHEPVELVQSYLDKNYKLKPLECLGESIKLMSKADYVLFAEGWNDARGCKIELACAVSYGKRILIENNGHIEHIEEAE